jgi:hypothetical protein
VVRVSPKGSREPQGPGLRKQGDTANHTRQPSGRGDVRQADSLHLVHVRTRRGVWPSPLACHAGDRGFKSHRARQVMLVSLMAESLHREKNRFADSTESKGFHNAPFHQGVAQPESALASEARGRRFKSCHPDQCEAPPGSHPDGQRGRDIYSFHLCLLFTGQ